MSVTTPALNEELLLARLTCSKLAKMLHGLLSVGLGAMESELVHDFIASRVKGVESVAEVLGMASIWHLAANTPTGETVAQWQKKANVLQTRTTIFLQQFLQLAGWRTLPPEELQNTAKRLALKYEQLVQVMQDYGVMLGVEHDFSRQTKLGREMVEAAVELLQRQSPPAKTLPSEIG